MTFLDLVTLFMLTTLSLNQGSTVHTFDNLFCSNSSPILELSVKFASQICHENINKTIDGAYLADFGIDISVDVRSKSFQMAIFIRINEIYHTLTQIKMVVDLWNYFEGLKEDEITILAMGRIFFQAEDGIRDHA